MERYLVFVGPYYYPSGGWGDFRSDHPTLPGAEETTKVILQSALEDDTEVWYEIVDTVTGTIVRKGQNA